MEQQYMDMYLRRKRGVGATDSAPVTRRPDAPQVPAESSDRVVRGTFSVQQFVDRTESLSQQLLVFEDKMSNLTKLVRMFQDVQEERASKTKGIVARLETRLQAEEAARAQLQSEFAAFREAVPQMIDKAVAAATAPLAQDMASQAQVLRGVELDLSRRISDLKAEMIASAKRDGSTFNQRLTQMEDSLFRFVRDSLVGPNEEIGQMRRRLDDIQTHSSDVHRNLEVRLGTSESALREAISHESAAIRSTLDKAQHDIHLGSVSQAASDRRLSDVFQQLDRLSSDLTMLTRGVHEASTTQQACANDVAKSLRELNGLYQQTHEAVEGLQAQKEWTKVQMLRAKKLIDSNQADVSSLQKAIEDVTLRLTQLTLASNDEHQKLAQLLKSKTHEAQVLTDIVDREMQAFHELAQRHRTSATAPLPAFPLEAPTRPTTTRMSMCDELALPRSHNASDAGR